MFSPIQSLLINPDNVSPVADSSNSSSASSYFRDPAVLDRVPASMLYLAAIYAAVLSIGLLLTSEPPQEVEEEMSSKQVSINFIYIDIYNIYKIFLVPGGETALRLGISLHRRGPAARLLSALVLQVINFFIYTAIYYICIIINYIYIIQVPLRDGGGRGAEPLEDIRLHTEQQRPDGRDGGECEVTTEGAVCG